MGPAIVIAAFERPASLKRLLRSLSASRISCPTPLIVSIDPSPGAVDAVRAVADAFCWPHGEKTVVLQPSALGLKRHILWCGDLSRRYGAVIVLEDDLYVSPEFHHYTLGALAAYRNDPAIAGISLYNHRFNETARLGFRPIEDGSDCYFMQTASSWGQCWTGEQWRRFRDWFDAEKPGRSFTAPIPHNVAGWPESSWKKFFIQYLVLTNRYFVYPRVSLTTNFGDPGTHYKERVNLLQVPLLLAPMDFRLRALSDSLAVYDSHCEILPAKLKALAPELAQYDFTVNLYGWKDRSRIAAPYVLTSRRTRAAIARFGLALKPHELNVVQRIEGTEISLARVEDCTDMLHIPVNQYVAYYFDMPVDCLR